MIKTRRTKRNGLAFDLYYRWQGRRYRPLLGYNLTKEAAERRALDMIQRIQTGERPAHAVGQSAARFCDALPLYWQALEVKKVVDKERPQAILETHLLPRFKDRRLDSLTAQDGLGYILDRQRQGAAAGTIEREWKVLMRILNLAVQYEKLDRNRLKTVELPESTKRTRVAEVDELLAIHRATQQSAAGRELWRIAVVAVHTGLREAKALSIDRTWIRQRHDGFWLMLPPAASRLKGTPSEIPLNRVALAAMAQEVPSMADSRVFRHWNDMSAFKRYWIETYRRAKVVDLHFHDLRHTFATWLQGLGVDYEIRQALLGHRMPGMTARYSHGGPEWNQKLRAAVMLLEKAYPLSYSLSYERQVETVGSGKLLKNGAEGQNRTVDTSLFRAVLCQLSYLGTGATIASDLRTCQADLMES